MKQWSDGGYASVKYGQCWVFACLLTTTMRTLGVAARPITNFRSAHESKPFDFYIDERTSDSIWNFHAWVDAKMSRPDISSAAVQWNAIDATPQETSGGKYQMGPASLPQMADNVAHGSSYDQTFVVSETNGIVLRNGQEIFSDVGRYISTKQPGCTGSGHTCRMDITDQYKKHDSPLTTEREAAALGKGSRMTSRHYDDLAGFALKEGSLAAGGDVQFHAVSTGGVKLNGGRGGAQAVFVVEAVSYTGVKIADLDVALAVVSPDGKTASIVVPEAVYARGGRAPWGFFHFFGSGTRVFSKDFYRQFLDFSENTLPPCRNMFSVFPFRGFFLAFFGFSELLPSRGHFEKNGQVLG